MPGAKGREEVNWMYSLRTLRVHGWHSSSVGREDWIPRKARLSFLNTCRFGMITCSLPSSRREFLEERVCQRSAMEVERRFLLVVFDVDPISRTQYFPLSSFVQMALDMGSRT